MTSFKVNPILFYRILLRFESLQHINTFVFSLSAQPAINSLLHLLTRYPREILYVTDL